MVANWKIRVILLALFGGLVGVLPNALHASENEFADIQQFTELHCQRLQRASLTAAPNLRQRVDALNEQASQPAPLNNAYDGAPDFGFLLPQYWPVMNWTQRVRFNHHYTALLKKRLNLAAQRTGDDDCLAQIRIAENTESEAEGAPDATALPAARQLKAIALLNLRDTTQQPVLLTYLLSQDSPNSGWQLDDMIIHASSLSQTDSTKLESIIRQHGIDDFERYLEKLTP